MKKWVGKTGDLINEKSSKLHEKMRRKTDYSFVRVEIIYKR